MSNNRIALATIAGLLVGGWAFGSLPVTIILSVLVVFFMWANTREQARRQYNRELRQWYEQNPQVFGPNPQAPTAPRPQRPRGDGWSIAGTSIAVVAAIGGLVMVGFIAIAVLSFANNPKLFSNK